jgi:predicted nucleotidyltransferase
LLVASVVVNLRDVVGSLVGAFGSVEKVYLFGSRRYRTGSTRSDIDLLVLDHDTPQKDILSWRSENEYDAVDVFRTSDGVTADSPVTGSRLRRPPGLVEALDAELLWTRESGFSEEFVAWEQEVAADVDFMLTIAGFEPTFGSIANRFAAAIAETGIPSTFLGSDWHSVAQALAEIIDRALSVGQVFNSRAGRLTKQAVHPETEYDFQNLIATALRPWIPTLEGETVTVRFAGQHKLVDFGLADNQLLIEAKHITDSSSAGTVIKTLEGLESFYRQHPNVKALLFVLLVEEDVKLDDAVIEAKYSNEHKQPYVLTRIYRNRPSG